MPFKQKAKYDREGHLLSPECFKAQFVLGYKGYIQLALRSGQYRKLGCMEIRQGEYLGKDPETAEPRFRFIEDDDLRERLPIVGYMAHFEYLNGFRKRIYWSREKVLNHAAVYCFALDVVYGLLQMAVALSLPVLARYNGLRGKDPRINRVMKWLFYLYYPLHLAILGTIQYLR